MKVDDVLITKLCKGHDNHEALEKLDTFVAFAIEHGRTLANHKEFGRMYQELKQLLGGQDEQTNHLQK